MCRNYQTPAVRHWVGMLPGHTKLGGTVRYLGIEVDDALEISEQTRSACAKIC